MYHIESVQLNELGYRAMFLVTESGHSFWAEWAQSKRTRDVAKDFGTLLLRIQTHGVDWAIRTGKMRVIDGGIFLAEIKSFSGVWRVACYSPSDAGTGLVLLKAFRGHQGTNKIPPHSLAELKKLASEAEVLLKETHDG